MIKRSSTSTLFLFFICLLEVCFGSDGKFIINPITDICWECIFPITISGVNVTPAYADQVSYSKAVCVCPGIPPKVGVPLTFWEPVRLVDVTRHAYKFLGL